MTSFSELSEELDIVYWLDREGVTYKLVRGKSGMQTHIKECPHCGDRRWKVYLNADTGLGNCFVCDTKFNKLSFIKTYTDMNWSDLNKYLVDVLKDQGWMPRKSTPVATDETKVKLPNCFDIPFTDGSNLVYLEKRGVNVDLAKYFGLRYCDMGWWKWKNGEDEYTQDFSERIIIPVYDLDGTLATFQGRDVTGTKDRKYLFPSQLPGSGRFLYNGQNVGSAKRVCVGEGTFDVIAIKKALDEDASLRDVVSIGTFGKHLSSGDDSGNDQLGRFLRLKNAGVREVTIMWDGERNAMLSALDAAKLLHGIGLTVKIAFLPENKDPNEVDGSIVRQAFYKAVLYTPISEIKMRLNCPYPDKEKAKLNKLMS